LGWNDLFEFNIFNHGLVMDDEELNSSIPILDVNYVLLFGRKTLLPQTYAS